MPRPQTPLAKAKLTGADKKHPDRFRDRSEPVASGKPIGSAPPYLSANAKKAWKAFCDELGWLVHEDRAALEVASIMRGEIMARTPDLPASFFTAYRQAISSLGATPVDRSKVHQGKPEEPDDPFAAFGGVQ
jgi:phage terminase small subunit